MAGFAVVGASSANISKSYNSSGSIQVGSLVSLDSQKTDYVEPSNTTNVSRLLGVATNSENSLLAVNPQTGKAQIVTSGTVNTLVSTFNGAVKLGDQITASPFNGIGMKAEPGSRVIGLAETAFDGTSQDSISKQVTDKNGKQRTIQVGYVRASVAVGTSPAATAEKLSALQKAAKSLTGRTISTFRIIASLTVLIITFLVLVTLIYSSIYSGIVSIGRNPLAKYSVFRALGSVMAMAFGLVILSGISIFLLLS